MLHPGAFADRQSLQRRLSVLRLAAILCFVALAASFWHLQVIQKKKYQAMADNNFRRTIPLRAPRGVLFDRDNRVLVENTDSFTIAIDRERTRDIAATIKQLAAVTHADEAEMIETWQRRRAEPIFRPLAVIEHASFSQVAAVLARQEEMPEIVVQQVPARTYPSGGLAAHLFGYVGEIQESQLDRPGFEGLHRGAIVGQTGLERVYNAQLMGEEGSRFVVVNSVGREIEKLHEEPPTEGGRLQLTIDADLQRATEEAFHALGYNGAAVFLDPNTGEVLAMTSLPAYDPNDFAVGITAAKWKELNTSPLKPLENRLIRGRYMPGSTFKIVVAIAGLAAGVIDPDFKVYCSGSKTFYGSTRQCWKAGGHGTVDLRHALEQSCNVYFYTVGDMLHIDKIHEVSRQLGLVGKTGIDLPGELDSVVGSTEWKMARFGQPWYPGDTISVAIGQGYVDVTPMALATMISTVANGGTLITPHLVRAEDPDGTGWRRIPTPEPKAHVNLNAEQVKAVREGLYLAVNGAGTGGRARIEGKGVAGKTGTAQVVSLENARRFAGKMDTRDHGFFVFFAPYDNPRIAGVIFAEHVEHGYLGAPIAKHVMETFFAKQEGRPLPTFPAPARTIITAPAAQQGTPGGAAPTLAPMPSHTSGASGGRTPEGTTGARERRGAVGSPRASAPGGVQGAPRSK
jgi:penicillin-binding protein 2